MAAIRELETVLQHTRAQADNLELMEKHAPPMWLRHCAHLDAVKTDMQRKLTGIEREVRHRLLATPHRLMRRCLGASPPPPC